MEHGLLCGVAAGSPALDNAGAAGLLGHGCDSCEGTDAGKVTLAHRLSEVRDEGGGDDGAKTGHGAQKVDSGGHFVVAALHHLERSVEFPVIRGELGSQELQLR